MICAFQLGLAHMNFSMPAQLGVQFTVPPKPDQYLSFPMFFPHDITVIYSLLPLQALANLCRPSMWPKVLMKHLLSLNGLVWLSQYHQGELGKHHTT